MRACKKCGESFPETTEFFIEHHGYLVHTCRSCMNAYQKTLRDRQVKECAAANCTNKVLAKGFCSTHYKHGRMDGTITRTNPAPFSEHVTYFGAHQRVRLSRGRASDYECSHCEKRAHEWALDHTLNKRWIEGENRGCISAYSLDVDDYIPLCRKCHRSFDTTTKNKETP